jgi:Na+-translocating ferredoxin:NAD+ oxidoreductase RnfE subunit
VRERGVLFLSAVVIASAVPAIALANAGVPMIGIVYPGMGILLIPVIVLEFVVLRRRLKSPARRTAVMTTVSNLVSTGVGVPLTWAVLVGLQAVTGGGGPGPSFDTLVGKLLAVTWQAPWMMPYESDLFWMVPVAALVLLVPFFFVSWLIEYELSRLFMRGVDKAVLRRAVLFANLLSYALLAGVAVVGLGIGIYQHGAI